MKTQLICLLFLTVATLAIAEKTPAIQRIAFGSCLDEAKDQTRIWEAVHREYPDMFIFAGDNIYADTEDPDVMKEQYLQLGMKPGFQKLRNNMPVLATWDDHDYGLNDAGASYSMKETSQKLFLEFWEEPENSPRWQQEGIYDSSVIEIENKKLQVILLDTRYHRSELERYPDNDNGYKAIIDNEATILGETQWAWLESELRKPADLRLIVSSIQFVAEEHIYEKWATIPRERRRMLDLIEDTKAEGIIFLSGDRHIAELSTLFDALPYPVYDLTSSGMTQSSPWDDSWHRSLEPNRHRIGAIQRGPHFGLVTVHWKEKDPRIILEIIDDDNERLLSHSIRLSTLQRSTTPPINRKIEAWTHQTENHGILRIDGYPNEWKAQGLYQDDFTISAWIEYPAANTFRRASDTYVLGLDLDRDTTTGHTRQYGQGIDLELELNRPINENESWRDRNRAMVMTDETPTEISISELDLQIAPTHATSNIEVNIDLKNVSHLALLLDENLPARGVIARKSHDSPEMQTIWEGDLQHRVSPKKEDSSEKYATAPLERHEETIRVVTYNVLWGSPQVTPEPFGRIFRALDADIYLIQEWDREHDSDSEIEDWFHNHVDSEKSWHAMSGGSGTWRGEGAVIVSRHPIQHPLPRSVEMNAGGWDFDIRVAGGLLQTPLGSVLTASVHYKAGGSLDSLEDVRRREEAKRINGILRGAKAMIQPDLVIFGGDINLNGSPDILTQTLVTLDSDGSALQIALPHHPSDTAETYTHSRGYPKNRLDYITFSDSSWEVYQQFVLDTAQWDSESLKVHGLTPEDTSASDHFPVVVDLVKRGTIK